MARKYAVRDFIIGDTSYHDTVDEALTRAIALVSSAYASLGFDYMDGAASSTGGSPWMTSPMEIWGMCRASARARSRRPAHGQFHDLHRDPG